MRAIDKLEPFQKAIAMAHLASAGISYHSLQTKPLIAIANSWNELCPGHEPLRELAKEVKKGIIENGGEPIEFNTIAMCDGIAQGHPSMKYCLPHREIIADSIEAMILGEGIFDGVVYMGSCDKIVPAMLNAAARIDLPSILVTAGPCYAEVTPNESKNFRKQFLNGQITEQELIENTLKYYTGPGICPFLGTANTMGCLAEGLGMMLPNGSLLPSSTAMRKFSARQSGQAIMELVKNDIRPSSIINERSLKNAVTLLSAIGGSLNSLLHLPALANEIGVDLTWDDISEITSKTPLITAIVPNGNRTVIELYKAGGIPAVMKELIPLLDTSVITVTGKTLKEDLASVKDVDRAVIKTLDQPIMKADGIQVLYGNLAKQGALVKTSAVPENFRIFTAKAMVFDSENQCYDAFNKKEITEGTVLVVRYEGPKGGPGMREMHRVTEIIKEIPNTAIITDGRFSGATGGLSVGYLCPEAADGGNIALVKDGDIINIDLSKNLLQLEVSEKELEERRKTTEIKKLNEKSAFLSRYSRDVLPANKGAILKNPNK